MIHEHSREAYHTEELKLSRRADAVLDWIKRHGPATDRDVMIGLHFFDMNSVRPRCTELVESGRLLEVGSKQCPVTKKRVRVLDVPLLERMAP